MSKPSRVRIISVVRLTLTWAVAVVALTFCIVATVKCWNKFISYGATLSIPMLISGLLCTLTSYLLLVIGWFFLMSSIASPIRFSTALRAWSYSLIARYVPGKLLVFVTRVRICQSDGALPSKVLAGTALETILSLASAITISLLSSFFAASQKGPWRLAYLAALILMLAVLHPKIITALMKLYYRFRGQDYQLHVPQIKLVNILAVAAIYFVSWLIYGLGGCFIFLSVVPDQSLVTGDVICLIGAFVFAWVVGYLFIIAPAGLGAREGALVWAISGLVPAAVGIVISALARLCQGVLDLGFAGFCWTIYGVRNILIRAGSSRPEEAVKI